MMRSGYIDYDAVRALALEHKPKLIVAGASAYPREIRFDLLRQIADAVGAKLMVDMAHIAGLVATADTNCSSSHAALNAISVYWCVPSL